MQIPESCACTEITLLYPWGEVVKQKKRNSLQVLPGTRFWLAHGVWHCGMYADGTILLLVIFTRDIIVRQDIEQFILLIVTLRAAIAKLAAALKFFAPDATP